MAHPKRKQYFIKRAFQLKYAGVVSLVVIASAYLSAAIVYFSIYPYLSSRLAAVYPQTRLSDVLGRSNSMLMIALVIILPLVWCAAIFLSHRIAGPWYRVEKIILQLARGEITPPIKLRKNDELKSLAEAINKLIEMLRRTREKNK